MKATTSSSTLEIARGYLAAGLGVLPIRPDGSKAPDLPKGNGFLYERPTDADLVRWFKSGKNGIAIPCGKVSGGLETLDFETETIYRAWCELVDAQIPGLVARLSWAKTPGHFEERGMHARYRCPGVKIGGSAELALEPLLDEWEEPVRDAKTGRAKAKLLIETRGEGGYAVAPGSPPACHETGRLWEHVSGPALTELPDLTLLEREVLLTSARALNSWVEESDLVAEKPARPRDQGLLPGDDFNARGPDWADVLGEGWICVRTAGEVRYWRRPGKSHCWSATTGYCRADAVDLLHVFSGSAQPFKQGGSYSKFRAFALLRHSGDFKAAATDLSRQGFGQRGAAKPAAKPHETNGDVAPPAPPPAAEPWDPPLPLSEIPEPPAFPLDVFPEGCRKFAEEGAWAVNCPVDFLALPMLAIAGMAIGNARRLALTRTHTQSACVWTVVVGNAGSGKTPALQLVARPFDLAAQLFHEEWEKELFNWNSLEEDARDERPGLRRSLVDNCTTEKLIAILSENPRGVGQVLDEMSGLLTGMDQYKSGGKGNDRQHYLSFWSGTSIIVDRKSNLDGIPLRVHSPFVGLTGGIQPSVVERLRGERQSNGRFFDDGMVDRFLFAFPKKLPAIGEEWREVSEEAETAWEALIYRLLALDMESADKSSRPYLQLLSASGRLAWQKFTRAHAAEVNAEDFPPHLVDPWSKMRGYCARLALILHHMHSNKAQDKEKVGGAAIEGAAQLIAYFKGHYQCVSAAMDLDPEIDAAKEILRWVRREKRTEFKLWEAHKDLKSQSRFPRLEDMETAVDRLCKHNYVRPREPEERQGRGRKTALIWEVNPNYSLSPEESGKSGN